MATGYGQVWSGMIGYVSQSSFSIENFDKDSELMTFGFALRGRDQYIDCGMWQTTAFSTVPSAVRKEARLSLRGSKMNIRVREQRPDQTSLQVTALCQLRDKYENYWEFTSNDPSTIRVTSGGEWRCRSKSVAESNVVREIQALTFRRHTLSLRSLL